MNSPRVQANLINVPCTVRFPVMYSLLGREEAGRALHQPGTAQMRAALIMRMVGDRRTT
jgi:hypothetical protein